MKHAILVSILCTGALAARAEVRSGEKVLVPAGEVVDGNLYAASEDVTIHGDVRGDAVVAGGTVMIDGHVYGDVMALGGEVTIAGTVDGDVRAAGGDVNMRTRVAGDAALAGGDVEMSGAAGGDAMLAGGTVAVSGPVQNTLYIAGGDTRLNAAVGANVMAAASVLRLDSNARIAGDLRFQGDDLIRSPNAAVAGTVSQRPLERSMAGSRGAFIVGWLQMLIGVCLFGALWLTLFRGFAQRSIATLREQPWRSLGIGAAVFFGVPLVLLVAFVVGALIGGWWIALFGGGIYVIALALCLPLIAALFGKMWLMPRLNVKTEVVPMLLVLVVLSLLMLIPPLAVLIGFAACLFGLGAIAITLMPTLRATRAPAQNAAPLPEPTPAE